MIPIEQNKIENYIADYYRSYFQMDSVYNDWALVNKIQDTTLFVLDELNKQQPTSQSSLKRRLGYPNRQFLLRFAGWRRMGSLCASAQKEIGETS